MKYIFVRHFLISFVMMLFVAIVSAYLQNTYSVDRLGILVFGLISIVGLLFSVIFAIFQWKLHLHIKDTVIWVGLLSAYLIWFFYTFTHLKIDWNTVSEGRVQLNLFQMFIKSELSFWLAFLIPFILSVLYSQFKSKMS